MDNEDNILKRVAFTAFMEATPYLEYRDWVEETYRVCLQRVENHEQLKKILEEEIKKQEDVVKRADLKIYLTYLEKVWRKSFG